MILRLSLLSSESSKEAAAEQIACSSLSMSEFAVMKKLTRIALMTLAVLAASGFPSSEAQACPGCKNANETDSLRPRAYMYSILFMLGMPATVFTGFGIAFYRMSRRAMLEQQEQLAKLNSEVSE